LQCSGRKAEQFDGQWPIQKILLAMAIPNKFVTMAEPNYLFGNGQAKQFFGNG
jgi:hypothetical protein